MRLVRRLTIYLLIPIGLVFALDTALTLRMDLALLDADMRRDDVLLARELALAVGRVWRDSGEPAAFDLVAHFQAEQTSIETRIVLPDGSANAAMLPAVPATAAAITPDAPIIQTRVPRATEARLYTYVALDVSGPQRVALEISEPLSHESSHLAARVPRKLGTAAAMVILCGLVAWGVGSRVVGRPVDALIAKARRIGAGDFSSPLALTGRGELSAIAREMNSMAEMLDASARRLANESAARIAALEQLRHADRLTTVGKLASGLAHELGTPLNVVSGRAQMILTGESSGRGEIERAARTIGDQAERMTGIVRQLLDFARHRGAKRTETDVVKLARETVGFLGPLAAKRSVRLSCEASEPVLALIDGPLIQQAVTNLVMNAVQASPRNGEVVVRVRERDFAEAPRPHHAAGRHVVLEVEDQGEGIEPENLAAIFDLFFTTKPVGEGTGLGLAVVYGILEEHGGWVEVRSEPGRGSCFTAFVPACSSSEASSPIPA